MTKGKFGLSTAAIAVIAFGFCALRQPQSVLLVVGFALLAEQDEWLNRQTMQALLLTITYYLTILVTDWVFGGLGKLFGFFNAYGAQKIMLTVNSFIGDLVYLALIVFSVLAVLRVLRGKDAGLPFIAKMAGGDLAAVFQKVQKQNPAPAQHQQPVTAQEYTPASQPSAESTVHPNLQVPMGQGAPSVRHCFSCGAALQEDSRFCTECGAKNE